MKVIVTGMIATYPVGGVAWDYAQYALALERLGFEVYYLEDTGWQTYNPDVGMYGDEPGYGVRFLDETLRQVSPTLGARWHFRSQDGQTYGLAPTDMADVLAEADLFLNISGGTLIRDGYLKCRRKVLIDTDPGWNHFRNFPRWDAVPGWQGSHGYRAHDHFFTYAESIGRPECHLPLFDLDWKPTRPCVLLDLWKPEPPGDTWTTVMSWKNFQEKIEYNGAVYGSKEMEFDQIQSLPMHTRARLEIASGGEPPREAWRDLGWSVVEGIDVSKSADIYRSYVQSSRAEFSVAKNVYTATRCGWFSCRTVCYLAAGRPAVVQETGFSRHIPVGDGLLAFNNLKEAIKAVDEVESDYAKHQAAARSIAEAYFDAKKVIPDLLNQVGL